MLKLYIIFQYIYLLIGKEILRTIADYLRFLLGGGRSMRLQSFMRKLGRWYKSMKKRTKKTDEYWLEKTILNTPTWYYDPEDFRQAVKNYYASDADE